MIKITIVDNQELIRQSLEILLRSVSDFEVLDAVSRGSDALRSIREKRPDIILMDIHLSEKNGVELIRKIKENYPDIKIIILTAFDNEEYIFNALKYGASGYLLKNVSSDELFDALRKIYKGTEFLNPDIAAKVLKMFKQMTQTNTVLKADKNAFENLRETEFKIIKQVGKGLSNKEIAYKLHLSEGTVRNSLSRILSKLSLRDRTQLAIWAVQTGIINEFDDD